MMRRFFKKLTFVMALSMVVSSASPAARIVSAADDRTLSIAYQNGAVITELNLTDARSSEDLKAVGAPSNWKELGMTWISSDPSIATVDKAGVVTAVSSGSTEIMVICGDYIGTITVNCFDAAKKYTATIGTADERSITEKTLAVGGEFDFNFYGIKDYGRDSVNNAPRYFCEWTSDDEDVAIVDKNGIVTAVAPGKAKITLVVWNLATGTQHKVTPCWVTVEADATPTPTPTLVKDELNETQNTVLINVDKNADLKLENVEFYRVFKADNDNNGDGVIDERDAVEPYQYFYVNTVKYDSDAEAWRITTFDDFTDGATYEVRANGRTEQFVASVGDVAKVVVYETKTAKLETEDAELEAAELAVRLYDAKGVNVTTRKIDGVKNNDSANISYDLTKYDSAYSLSGNEVEFYEDTKATVIATYNYNNLEVHSAPYTLSPSTRANYGVAEIVAWTLVNDANDDVADWTKLVKEVPAGEDGYVVVTLLKDTRGQYFTTHKASASVDYKDADGVTHDVEWTENEDAAFWKNGLYVEYKAMNPDKMLVENYGEVASYEQGKARFALYLYNYNQYNDEFVKELGSYYVTVCHPMDLNKMTSTNKNSTINVSVMTDTKDEKSTGIVDAYYSKFSTTEVEVLLWDVHSDTYAKDSDADSAEFTIQLTSNKLSSTKESEAQYEALRTLIEDTYADRLSQNKKDGNSYHRYIDVDAEELVAVANGRTQIKFKITETTTKTSVNVTINLVSVNYTDPNNGDAKSDVALVKELLDKLGTSVYFEKFVVDSTTIAVEQKIYNAANDKTVTKGHEIFLKQADRNGNVIGYDSNLYVGTTAKAGNIADILDPSTTRAVTTLNIGDRVLTVKDPSGKVYTGNFANAGYNKKLDGTAFSTVATSSLESVIVNQTADTATSSAASGSKTTDIAAYSLIFREKLNTGEIIYAKNGRYTLTISTVEDVDANGDITYATGAGLKNTITINVTNSNPEVTYASRNLTRIENASLPYTTAGSYTDADPVVIAAILDAFNFNLDGSVWSTSDDVKARKALTANDILYYTCTVTPSNKQIVINTVTFKVPVYNRDSNGVITSQYGWYRSTATVNKSLTFEY